MKDLTSETIHKGSSETYIAFLSQTLGASREEILEVTRRSGISTRRIAEYLLKQRTTSHEFSDDE